MPVIAWRVEAYDELESTSDLCIARAKAGEAAGLAVRAALQTAGRGSRGRRWQAAAGNLNLSVLLRPVLPAAEAGLFSLLAGLAVAQAAEQFLPRNVRPSLKWPNDVMLDGAKLGGILIDAVPAGSRLDWLVIGIGVNLREAPVITGRRTTALAAHGNGVDAAQLAGAVLERLSFWLAVLPNAGPALIHASWLERAHPVGTPLQVQAARTTLSGRFAGLSSAGELLLNVDNRIERISTGDVMLGSG